MIPNSHSHPHPHRDDSSGMPTYLSCDVSLLRVRIVSYLLRSQNNDVNKHIRTSLTKTPLADACRLKTIYTGFLCQSANTGCYLSESSKWASQDVCSVWGSRQCVQF